MQKLNIVYGSWIRYRINGFYQYARYLGINKEPGLHRTASCKEIPDEAIIYNIIWKTQIPEIRGSVKFDSKKMTPKSYSDQPSYF